MAVPYIMKTILLLTMSILKCTGYSIIEIKQENETGSDKLTTVTCNTTFEYTKSIKSITVSDKLSESTDKCYCMMFHPTDQSLLDDLKLIAQTFSSGKYVHWNNIPKQDWYTQLYKVPVFYIEAGNNRLNIQNKFYTYNGEGNKTSRVYVPVLLQFNRTNGGIFTPIHLRCSPKGYSLPEVLIPTTIAPKTTAFIPTTPESETTAAVVTTPDKTTVFPDNNPEKTTDNDDEDDTIILIAAVVGAIGGILILTLIIIVIVLACKKRNHRKWLAKKNYYHQNYYADINHNGIEDYQEPSTSSGSDGHNPHSTQNHTYINKSYQTAETDINPYSSTQNVNDETQPVRRVHYAEVEFNNSESTQPPATGNITYADLDFPSQQNADASEQEGSQSNPVYAQAVKKHLRAKTDAT